MKLILFSLLNLERANHIYQINNEVILQGINNNFSVLFEVTLNYK
jgi:hypothetical protein